MTPLYSGLLKLGLFETNDLNKVYKQEVCYMVYRDNIWGETNIICYDGKVAIIYFYKEIGHISYGIKQYPRNLYDDEYIINEANKALKSWIIAKNLNSANEDFIDE